MVGSNLCISKNPVSAVFTLEWVGREWAGVAADTGKVSLWSDSHKNSKMNANRYPGAGWELSGRSLVYRAFSEHLLRASLTGNNMKEKMILSSKGHNSWACQNGSTAKPNGLSLIQTPHGGRRELSPTSCTYNVHVVLISTYMCMHAHTHKGNVIKALTRSTGVMEETPVWAGKGKACYGERDGPEF